MSYPKPTELQKIILEELRNSGGEAKLSDLYERVTKRFPQLTKEDLEKRTPTGSNWWTGYIRFGLDALRKKVLVARLSSGVWGISSPPPLPPAEVSIASGEEFHSIQITLPSEGRASIVVPARLSHVDVKFIYKVLLSFVQD